MQATAKNENKLAENIKIAGGKVKKSEVEILIFL